MQALTWGIYHWFDNGLLRHLLGKYQPSESGEALLTGAAFLLCIIVSYLLGSINWAIVISRIFYRDDIRKHGSGNAGATNMLRTYGVKAALPTLLLDGLKGVMAIVFAGFIFGFPGMPDPEPGFFHTVTSAYMAGFFAILGHVFPCFYRFKGGKGVACSALVVLALNPFLFAILFFVFLVLVIGTKFVSLGSVISVLLYPIFLSSFDAAFTHYGTPTFFALLIAALVTWAHRSNIKRIMNHTENKISFRKKEATESSPQKDDTKQ